MITELILFIDNKYTKRWITFVFSLQFETIKMNTKLYLLLLNYKYQEP